MRFINIADTDYFNSFAKYSYYSRAQFCSPKAIEFSIIVLSLHDQSKNHAEKYEQEHKLLNYILSTIWTKKSRYLGDSSLDSICSPFSSHYANNNWEKTREQAKRKKAKRKTREETFLIANSTRSREQSRSIRKITSITLSRSNSRFTGVCRRKKTGIDREVTERRILVNGEKTNGKRKKRRKIDESQFAYVRFIMLQESCSKIPFIIPLSYIQSIWSPDG